MKLPIGYDSDESVGYAMLVDSMERHGLTPVGVQNHGRQIVDALNADYPELRVYLSPTDSPVWPGHGSLDVTVNSGLGGWSFRPDHYFPYEPAKAPPAGHDTPAPVPQPNPIPNPPADDSTPGEGGILAILDARLEGLERLMQSIATKMSADNMTAAKRHEALMTALNRRPDYAGTVKIPYLGTVSITLTPKQ